MFLADTKAANDVRMVELGHETRFPVEALHEAFVAGQVLRHDFDRGVAIQTDLVRFENLSHPTRAELLDQLEVAERSELLSRSRRRRTRWPGCWSCTHR